MKAQYKVSPTLIIEVEGSTPKELFGRMAEMAEVFGEKECGLCGGKDIAFAKRNVDGNDFFEYACQGPACGARLSLGQSKKRPGEMFPIRKLTREGKPSRKDGQYGPHNGWTKYRGKATQEEE